MRFETLAVHAGRAIDPATGAVATPIHLSSTYARGPDGQGLHGFGYARYDNPNRHALEVAVAALEGGIGAMAYSSGSAVTTAVCRALGPGALVLAPDDLFYGTRTLLLGTLKEWGLQSQFVDMSDLAALRAALTAKPRLLWLETPSNPRLKITDLGAASELAHQAGALVVADNTWATPTIQTPIALGADVVIHSAVKYFGGHSDTSAGLAVVARDDGFSAKLREIQKYEGAVPSPFDCWLVHRGLHSLPARMRQHCDTAAAVAGFLSRHPRVEAVHYPGLRSHPGHAIAAAQMKAGGGMVSFQVRGGRDEAIGVASRTALFIRAGSLGGVESLIQHHATVEGPGSKTPQNLLRLSIGLEHPEDLINDLDHALGRTDAA